VLINMISTKTNRCYGQEHYNMGVANKVLMGTGKRCAYGSTPSDGLEIIDNIMTASGRSGVVINILVDMWP